MVSCVCAGIFQSNFHVCSQDNTGQPATSQPPVTSSISSSELTSQNFDKFALLVGISKYEHLSEQLDGCENDVQAIRDVLVNRFQFPSDQITTLLNEAATAKGIRQAFETTRMLVEQSRTAGRQPIVYFHFSGHGSQVADQPITDKNCDEVDGLDQTIVPYDAQRQGGEHDIRDDELYEFVTQICTDNQTRLWCVLDCCHSGGGVRGTTKFRKLERVVTPRPADSSSTMQPKRLPTGAVFLSACQAHELEPEYQDGDVTYGLLTRFLVQSIHETASLSNLSYELLLQTIVNRYQRDRSLGNPPAPTLEFGATNNLHESILGAQGVDRPMIWRCQYESEAKAVRLNAGLLHGLTVGTILEAYPAPADVDVTTSDPSTPGRRSLCFLEITHAAGATSLATPFQWQGDSKSPFANAASLNGSVAIERYRNPEAATLRLHVQIVDRDGSIVQVAEPSDNTVPSVVSQALEQINQGNADKAFQWVSENDNSHIVLRIFDSSAALFPSSGQIVRLAASESTNPLRGGWGPIDLTSTSAEAELRDYLLRIAKAQNLLNVAATASSDFNHTATTSPTQLPVSVNLVKVLEVDKESNVTRQELWELDANSRATMPVIVMQNGDQFTFQINNHSSDKSPVYVTLLQINSDMSIDQIHPWQSVIGSKVEGQQRIDPNQSLTVPGYFVCNGDDGEKLYGSRWAVLLATRQQNEFYRLAQGGLPITRSIGTPGSDRLYDLLLSYTEFKTRGLKRPPRPVNAYDDSWGASVLHWQVLPPDQPE